FDDVRLDAETTECSPADADGDGEADATDRCGGTPPGTGVDSGGCSLAQFCAGFDVTTKQGERECKAADWKNDEALLKGSHGNCTIDKGASRSRADNKCVPR